MKILKMAVLGAVMALAPVGSVAAKGLGVEALGTRAQGEWGGELGLGYNAQIGPIAIRPIGGVFIHQGDNDRYYEDTFSNGQTRCRDSQNGQFASDSKCVNVGFDWYAKAEAAYVAPGGFEIGGGARFSSEKVRPYGLVAFQVARNVKLHAAGGDHYFAGGVRLGF